MWVARSLCAAHSVQAAGSAPADSEVVIRGMTLQTLSPSPIFHSFLPSSSSIYASLTVAETLAASSSEPAARRGRELLATLHKRGYNPSGDEQRGSADYGAGVEFSLCYGSRTEGMSTPGGEEEPSALV